MDDPKLKLVFPDQSEFPYYSVFCPRMGEEVQINHARTWRVVRVVHHLRESCPQTNPAATIYVE